MRFCGVTNERNLPSIYADLSNCKKAERQVVLEQAFEARSSQLDAATTMVPVASKELMELLMMGNFAPKMFEMDDLTKGLSPFMYGVHAGSADGGAIQTRAHSYDMMMHGLAAPTIQEQAAFSTKDVSLPVSPESANILLRTYSVLLDVLQGANAPLAATYRMWVLREWPEIQATLHLTVSEGPMFYPTVIPRIVRWVQTRIAVYLRQVALGSMDLGREPDPPDFQKISLWAATREWMAFPVLPAAYRVADPLPAYNPPPGQPGGGGAANEGNPDPAPRNGRGGAIVLNAQPVQGWIAAFGNSAKTLGDIQEHAPNTNVGGAVCLSWHLRGQCVEQCPRRAAHRRMQAQKQEQQLPPP